MDGKGAQPGRDEDEDDPGDVEEAPQVDPDPGREDRVTDRDRRRQPGQGRDEGLDHGAAAGGPDREQEQHRLESFACDRDEGESCQREHRSTSKGDIHALLQFALHRPALPAHPEQHPGQDDDRDDSGQSFDAFLDDEREASDRRHHCDPDRDRQDHRGADPDPDAAQRVAPIELDQVGTDDPDDQGGFESFAKADEERGGHGRVASQGAGRADDGQQGCMTSSFKHACQGI